MSAEPREATASLPAEPGPGGVVLDRHGIAWQASATDDLGHQSWRACTLDPGTRAIHYGGFRWLQLLAESDGRVLVVHEGGPGWAPDLTFGATR